MRRFSLTILLFMFVLTSQIFAQGYDLLVRKAENLLREQKYEVMIVDFVVSTYFTFPASFI